MINNLYFLVLFIAYIISIMNTKEFLHSIPKSGKPISNQQDLIDDLTIALGLVEM